MQTLKRTSSRGAVKDVVSFVLAASTLLLVVLGLLNRQYIFDFIKLQGYTPPAEIIKLAEQSTMNDSTKRIFYVNHPELQDKAAFKIDCPDRGGEKTIVLGCYHGGQRGIFLPDVTDPRLEGIEQVTAAHELLHAAYERLSAKERKQVDAMLLNYYDNILKDERILNTIEGYKKTEPNDLVNEMHSIFATEIKTLPEELETYYAQYFSNRLQIVGFAEQYQAEFTSRQNTVTNIDAQLTSLETQKGTAEKRLSELERQLVSRKQQLDAYLRNGNAAAFNNGVNDYNNLVIAYNATVEEIKTLVEQYNLLVVQRNNIALEIEELSKALNTDAEQIKQ